MIVKRVLASACLAFLVTACAHARVEEADAGGWDQRNLDAIVNAVQNSGEQGLDPANYDVLGLQAALALGGEGANEAATEAFFTLAADLYEGAFAPVDRTRWHIAGPSLDPAAMEDALSNALDDHDIEKALSSFEPPQPQYAALKAALAATPQGDAAAPTLKLNMERWRWMPRALGDDYVLVNVPAYEVIIVRHGKEIDRRKVIVGKTSSPTPQFGAVITGVSFNPTWYVPGKIVAESVGALLKNNPDKAAKEGYYVAPDGGVRQKPGDGNALGKMKLVMPNPYAIYLHDTPAKTLFARDARAFSHGCIRVDGALDFASLLLGSEWNKEQVDDLVATKATVTVDLQKPLPVYVAYFTADVVDGAVRYYPDVYGLDREMIASQALAPAAPAGAEEGGCYPGETN